MRLVCGPETFEQPLREGDLRVVLYGQPRTPSEASAGDAVMTDLRRQGLNPHRRAWDLLSIALSIITADFAVLRDVSPDGWTREIELDVAVSDPAFWNTVADDLKQALAFLTTDRWKLTFHEGGVLPAPPKKVVMPKEDCVVLLSGGLDSLVGAIDLTRRGLKPVAVSQTVRGDGMKQRDFVQAIGLTKHLQLNHVATSPNVQETSQRARSLIFLTFGVVVATSLEQYAKGKTTPLYVCENGFIAINPPLTGSRLGSLSTRTAHPFFLTRFQKVLDAASLNVKIENPYAQKTKGEMLIECKNQVLLQSEAAHSTSCGRFQRFNYRHCGRCVPCQVRRAAFVAWDAKRDTTDYVYEPLGRDDEDHASFDDVRSVAIALASVKADGLDRWLGHTLSPPDIGDRNGVRGMLDRGLNELGELHRLYGVK
ncbi:Qat anti-phage system QueC-like protein QatC [Agrobacterium tumefaciens]|uniref:Qat anti-phage system QueC-like protein QatC n=1 Tax=Agrobacterium tumefaciens TaxID=358 RepID=UPI0015731AD4|nr:Qat anti-phage system QueC-like protein QatC [Agrobacterium tumefaciens]WCK68987.1 7-cyano-7-deazaguanine synthase [Agrobacterium tumefaciens]